MEIYYPKNYEELEVIKLYQKQLIEHYKEQYDRWFLGNKKKTRIDGRTCKKIAHEYWIIYTNLENEFQTYNIFAKSHIDWKHNAK